MRLGLHQSARMEQRLVQSPQMIQAMQILQMPATTLEERIEQELTENPFLEQAEGDGTAAAEIEGGPAAEERATWKELEQLEERYRGLSGPSRGTSGARGHGGAEDEDPKFLAMQNTPARYQSLGEALADQVGLFNFGPRQRVIAEYLVYSLDDRGFLREPLETLAEESPLPGTTVEELSRALSELRAQLHPALGAHDLRECLLLQLEAHGETSPLVRQIVEGHLDDVVTNRLPRIAKSTGSTLEDVKDAIAHLRELDPHPAREFPGAPAAAISPDVVVEETDGEYVVRLARPRSPMLKLSGSYRELLKRGGSDPAVQQWVRKRLESARWFLDAVAQRESTLERIAKSVFTHQREFLDKGVKGLKPLRMQEVADEAHVHISTVSRAVSGKHAQTPQGIHPLKYFFTGGTAKDTGEVESQASIKERVREIIEKEDRGHPLSDDQIGEILEKESGVKIARRTVTKYRKALGIPPSTQRKSF